MSLDLKTSLDFSEKLALKVGKLLVDKQTKVNIVNYKTKLDIVTSSDLAAEKLIIKAIKKNYPNHGITSEEAGHIPGKSDYNWIVDPLDGTKGYAKGRPLFSTCFSLEKNQQTVLSIVYLPKINELYSAAQDVGTFQNRTPVKPSSQTKLNHSYIYAYIPTYKLAKTKADFTWEKLALLSRKAYRLRGIGNENTALSWLAAGKIEAHLSIGDRPLWHDVTQGIFLAQNSGAIVTDIKGNPIKTHLVDSGLVASANQQIHTQLLKLLS